MQENDRKPELYKVTDLNTYRQWFTLMEDYGHIWFYDDILSWNPPFFHREGMTM